MATQLVRALAACFETDPLIDEYDFVPLLDASSSFLVESHKLAISAAAVKPLFREAHAAFQALLQQQGEHLQHQQQAALMLDVTRALLLVNPDVYTAWNARKRLVAAGTISEPSELAFVDLVFSKHTKKACAWAHRRWCLARLWAGDRDGDGDDEAVIDAQEAHELDVTASIAERYPKNYYAWTHRWWAVETGAARRRRRRLRRRGGAEPWLEAQVAFGAAWVERHAWDMSAVSFLHQALAAWAKETEDEEQEDEKEGHTVVAVTARLCEMLDAGSRKLDQCPGHESLWYQRRGLLALWVEQQQRQQQRRDSIELSSIKPPSPPTASVDEGVPAFPYPPPLEEGGNDGMGARMGWELGMAAYYQGGQGPFHTEAGGGLLWEEAARRRQRRCAWAHARWVVELVQRHGGDDSMREWWAPRLGQAGLEEVRHAVGFVPPGYSKLVAQLAT